MHEAELHRGKPISVFTLSDSFSMEAIQIYKLKVSLLSLLWAEIAQSV